jgi:hypothetical protein
LHTNAVAVVDFLQAPEQFEGCSVTDKVDVFAFAVMLWECFEQQQPWKELSPMQIIYSVGLQVGWMGDMAACFSPWGSACLSPALPPPASGASAALQLVHGSV